MISEKAYKSHFKVEKKKPKASLIDLLNKDIKIAGMGNGLKNKHKESFYKELSTLLNSGIDLADALDIVSELYSKKQPAKEIALQLRESLISGSSFHEALRDSGQFSTYELFSIQIGEETGKLASVMAELHSYYQRMLKQKRKITSALSYPILVSLFAAFAVFIMLRFIVPMLSNVYKQFDGELPGVTKLIMNLSEGLRNYGLTVLIIVLAIIGTLFLFRKRVWFRKVSGWLLLNIPIFGSVVRKVYLSRFSHAMSLMLHSGTPLLKALGLSRQMMGNYQFETALKQVEKDLLGGKSLHESLKPFPIFDRKLCAVVKVGENTNKLQDMFEQLNQQYADDIEYKSENFNNLLEPILIIGLGGVIGFILLALYLPIFDLTGKVF